MIMNKEFEDHFKQNENEINYDGLKEEAEKAIALLDDGESLEMSEEYKIKKVQESIDSLSRYCYKTGKVLIGVKS